MHPDDFQQCTSSLRSPLANDRPLWSFSTIDHEQRNPNACRCGSSWQGCTSREACCLPTFRNNGHSVRMQILVPLLMLYKHTALWSPNPALSSIVLSSAVTGGGEKKWPLGWSLQGHDRIVSIKERLLRLNKSSQISQACGEFQSSRFMSLALLLLMRGCIFLLPEQEHIVIMVQLISDILYSKEHLNDSLSSFRK